MFITMGKHLRNNPDVQLSPDTRMTHAADGKWDKNSVVREAEATIEGKTGRLSTLRVLADSVWGKGHHTERAAPSPIEPMK